MNRKLIVMLTFVIMIAFASGVQAEVKDPIGVVTLRPGEPIHIAYWVVISGPNTSLGTDVVRGIEIAMDDFGGQIKGFPLKLSGQDAGWRLTRPSSRPSAPPARARPNPAFQFCGRPAFRPYRPPTPLRF